MKSNVIKQINKFENTWIDRLTVLNVQFKRIPADDAEFIEYIDDMLDRIFIVLIEKISGVNAIVAIKSFERAEKTIKLEVLKKLTIDFSEFVHAIREIFNEPVVKE